MPSNRLPILIGCLFVAFILLNNTFFIVDETKQVIVLQFGNPQRTIKNAGIYFKLPMIQQAEYFEKRVLDVDPEPEQVLLASTNDGFMASLAKSSAVAKATGEDEFTDSGSPIIVDTFARYRITDPLKFLQRMGSEEGARVRISNEMNGTTRDVLGRSTIEKVLSKERSKLMDQVKIKVNKELSESGVEIVDIRINRADLTGNLKEATFNRMRSEREQRAAEIRSLGEKRALEIRSNADKDSTVLLAEAHRQAQFLRGKGDNEASRIYSRANEADPDFYRFYRSIQAYNNTLTRSENTLVLSPDSAFFKTLRGQ